MSVIVVFLRPLGLRLVAHHPVHVDNSVHTIIPYEFFKPSYVWPGRPAGQAPPPLLASRLNFA